MELIDYIVDLSKKNYEAIGFLPRPTLERYLGKGQVLVAYENDEPCGFLVFGNGWPVMRIYQHCIQYDARRIHHGFNLLQKLIAIAECRAMDWISLWCADDLDANHFWKAMGFQYTGQRDVKNKRGRKHNHWIFYVSNSRQMRLFVA